MNITRHFAFTFVFKTALALALFFVHTGSAHATLLQYSWTAEQILAAYSAQAGNNPDEYNLGFVDLYARPDDALVGSAYQTVWFPAPTFAGTPTNPWEVAISANAPNYGAIGPWTHFYDKADTNFIYLTAFTGPVLVYQEDGSDITGKRFQATASFTVLLNVSAALVNTPLNFQFVGVGSAFDCNGAKTCEGELAATTDTTKHYTALPFTMTGTGTIFTPEPSTAWLACAGFATIFGVLRRRQK